MSDKPPANLRPIMYSHRVHELQTITRSAGYSLALHGSMQRDLDAIAVPWIENAEPADELVARICSMMGLSIAENSPTDMPHGRRTWSLLLMSIGFIDLSVMPRIQDIYHEK